MGRLSGKSVLSARCWDMEQIKYGCMPREMANKFTPL